MPNTSPLSVAYFDGKSSRRQTAVLSAVEGGLRIVGEWGEHAAKFADLRISEPMGSAPRTVRFRDEAFCEVADHAAFANLLAAAGYRESHAVRLHSRWRWAAGALLLVSGLVACAYFFFLPFIAEKLAPHIPQRFVEHISVATLNSLDEHFLQASTLPLKRQGELQEKMRDFSQRAGNMPSYRLHFRSAGKMPPNAFALPNGDIVVFDSLAAKLSDGELIAVFGHELGHVAARHGVRRLMQSAVVSVFAAVYFGDVSSLATGLAAASLEARYSQRFELEADRFGGLALQRADMSPALLADALEKLDRPEKSGTDWLSSHPESAKRIALLRSFN